MEIAIERGLAQNEAAKKIYKRFGEIPLGWIRNNMFTPQYGHIVHESDMDYTKTLLR